ncbi:TetR/AcrR family transcriptional regulator [Glaciihabitans sp. INWT7]|uniref:TetR/AcrR family transcriptional regulator n=1 Tax=Glaciihabitans sp. INWT7 TaxID=2596912 RepID=UPI001627EF7F|nr:TetR family transcriptional regulator [Glaciihabitans sp. INWT7]
MLSSEDTTAATLRRPAGLAMDARGVALSTSLRQRLSDAAYPLFIHRGVRNVSLHDIQSAAGVGSDELASVYGSRDEAAAEFLARHARDWTVGTVEAGAHARGNTAEERMLAIFDVFDEWFHREDFEACSFISVMLEMGVKHPLGKACIEYLGQSRQIVTGLAEEMGLPEPEEFAHSWHILMKGSIIAAAEGDLRAATRAQGMARALIREHRVSGLAETQTSGIEWSEWDALLSEQDSPNAPRGVSATEHDLSERDAAFALEYGL